MYVVATPYSHPHQQRANSEVAPTVELTHVADKDKQLTLTQVELRRLDTLLTKSTSGNT